MNKQGHDETVTIRMTPEMVKAIDKTAEILKLTKTFNLGHGEEPLPTRSATIRFLILAGMDRLKNGPSAKGPRTGKKSPSTTVHHSG